MRYAARDFSSKKELCGDDANIREPHTPAGMAVISLGFAIDRSLRQCEACGGRIGRDDSSTFVGSSTSEGAPMRFLRIISFVIVAFHSTPSGAYYWVSTNSGWCKKVCEQTNGVGVSTGTFSNGHNFYICRTNAHGEGPRPGYNLFNCRGGGAGCGGAPDWSFHCWVGWGGQEQNLSPYECMCETPSARLKKKRHPL